MYAWSHNMPVHSRTLSLAKMTDSIEVANVSLRELKAHRDELAREHARAAKSEAGAGQQIAQRTLFAVKAFTRWFRYQHQVGGLALPADGRIEVLPKLSQQFCIGMHDLRYFIGIPKACAPWFLDMPWLHSEVSEASSMLVLRCDGHHSGGMVLPSFALEFNVQPDGYIGGLLHYHYLDVRVIEQTSSSNGALAISREVYLTLNINVAKSVVGAGHRT